MARITQKQYDDIYRDTPDWRVSADAEWRRRGFTFNRKTCGCTLMTREVVGGGQTTIEEYCKEHSESQRAIPLRIQLENSDG